MDPRNDQFERHGDALVKLEDAIELFRPDDFVGRHPPGKAADPAEMLALGQKRLAAAQVLLRLLALGDVAQVTGEWRWSVEGDTRDGKLDRKFSAAGAYRRHLDAPSDHPRFAGGKVAGKSQPVLLPERGRDDDVGQMLAHDIVAAVAESALSGRIELGDAAFVIDAHNAVECRVQDRCPARFSLSAVFDVGLQDAPADDAPLGISQREAVDMEPAVDAIGAAVAAFDFIAIAGFDRLPPHRDDVREIIRMNGVGGRPAFQVIESLAEIFQGQLIDEFNFAGCRRDGDGSRNAVNDQSKITQGLFGSPSAIATGASLLRRREFWLKTAHRIPQ